MTKEALRNVFGKYLVELGEKHKDLLVISCDLKSATKTSDFFKKYPNRSFEVGIAEANGLGISAGLALSGFKTLISSFGAFIAGKQLEIRTSISYNNAPVKIIGTHGGFIGTDGATQAGTQDISIIAFRPPSSIAMRNLEDSISGFDEEYIKRELEDMGVQWLDFREGDFNSYDGSHLHFESAKKLSILLRIEVSKLFENQTSEDSQNNNY